MPRSLAASKFYLAVIKVLFLMREKRRDYSTAQNLDMDVSFLGTRLWKLIAAIFSRAATLPTPQRSL
jgi:hypothetical protein